MVQESLLYFSVLNVAMSVFEPTSSPLGVYNEF
jgi:hypothetical protein